MAAPNPGSVAVDPDPLNVPFVHPLPVLPFPAQDEVNFGDLYALPGDTGALNLTTALSYEPSQH